jgi:carbamate kinase
MTRKNETLTVLALGGNALIRQGEKGEIEQQRRHIREALEQLPALLDNQGLLLITHGNGPVVGNLLLQNEAAREIVPPVPLDVCDADSEGSIGYMIQQEMVNRLRGLEENRPVVSVITQVVVDAADPGFVHPTKPVGPFYTRQEAEILRRARGWTIFEDAGRGYRRVVPSPRPLEVIESEPIRLLLRHGVVVIAGGGGGIPVIRNEDGMLRGVEAVVDKDLTTALLAKSLRARRMVFLTAVDCVYRHFGRSDQEPLSCLSIPEVRHFQQMGEFPPGSMGPKIEAALDFLETGGQEVLITSPECLTDALGGKAGTCIIP